MASPLTRFWGWVKDRQNTRELAGYVVWGLTGAVIAIPELLAAADSRHVPWPTISGTIGYLEYWHTWIAVVVIGVLVWAVFHSVKYSAGVSGGKRTPGGRLTSGTASTTPMRMALSILYYLLAIGCTIAGPLIVRSVRPHDKFLLGEVLYASIAFFGLVVPGIIALVFRQDVPFPTLFWTIQKLEDRLRALAIVIAAGITVLLIHLALYPWPSVIPDLQDLHTKNQQLKHDQKKDLEPSPYAG
jgi:hypothetical protein